MIRYHLKSSFALLKKNSMFSILNISGFAIGLTAFMLLALYIQREYSVDTSFPNYQNIYRLIDAKKNKAVMDGELALALKQQFPDIEMAVPVVYTGTGIESYIRDIKKNESVLFNKVTSTTNDYFKLFSTKLLEGNPEKPFTDGNSVVLTRTITEKLFGRLDVVGEQIDLMKRMTLTISAIVEDPPANSSMNPELFLNAGDNPELWMSVYCDNNVCYNPLSIYVSLAPSAEPEQTMAAMNAAFPVNKSETDSIKFQALKDIYLTEDIESSKNEAGSKTRILIFIAIAVSILLLSVFNYINFSLSRQLSTLKQMGIRITNGATIPQLRAFYVTETTLTVLLSFLLALVLMIVSLPYASSLLDTELQLSNLFSPQLVFILLAVWVVVVLLASLAPLYIISKFDIQSLLGKKSIRLGKQQIRQVLTVLQLIVSIVLLTGLLTINGQLNYLQQADMGFNKEHLVKLSLSFGQDGKILKHAIEQAPFVVNSSLSTGTAGIINYSMGLNEKDDHGKNLDIKLDCIGADMDYLKTMGIELISGREITESDFDRVCYLNEEAYKQTEWSSYEGKRFNNNGGFDIIGIVKDFNISSLHSHITPVSIVFSDRMNYNNLSIRLMPGNVPEQMGEIEKIWKKTAPDIPFNFTFYDELFNAFYQKEMQQAKAIGIFSVLALIITCMGLLGQIFQTCLMRMKEIGIRKINGASVTEIVLLLNRKFIKSILISFVVAIPISYYVMSKWLDNFAYKISISWWIFVCTGIVVLILSAITISLQTWKAATANPVDSIKNE